MKFIVMHRTDPRWEAGERPSEELIRGVGGAIAELQRKGQFVAGEGLRASSLGVRLSFTGGKRHLTRGPFKSTEVLPSSFHILKVASLDEAVDWSTRLGQALTDVQIEVRPVTEAWDLGFVPMPQDLKSFRYMALVKDPHAEDGTSPPSREAARARVVAEMEQAGALLGTVVLNPSSRGARFRRGASGFTVTDGPFAEAKELIAGYLLVDLPSREDAIALTHRYAAVLTSDELDVREVAG